MIVLDAPAVVHMIRPTKATDCQQYVDHHFIPFHAFPGPGPGILILTTMPIPDRVRASLQLIG